MAQQKQQKMVIIVLQQSTFQRCPAKVLSTFFISAVFVNWCDKLRFFAFITQ